MHRLAHTCAKKAQPGNRVLLTCMPQMCSVCRHCLGIHVPSLGGGVSQTVTHAPRNGEGGKVSLDTLLLKCVSPTPLWYRRRTFILNFGSDVFKAPIFFS